MEEERNKLADDIFLELDDIDRAIIERKRLGMSNTDIGKELGKDRNTIAKRLKKENVKQILAEHSKTALDIIIENQQDIVKTLIDGLKSPDERVKIKAAEVLLKKILGDKHNINANINSGTKRLLDYMDDEDVDHIASEIDE